MAGKLSGGIGEERSWWQRVLKRVSHAVHDPNRAEDYLHSAFIRLEAYREQHIVHDPAAFLVRTAVNIAIDESRSHAARNHAHRSLANIFNYTADQPLQSEVLVARERLKRVQEGLTQLSPRTREVFLMHRLEGMKYREIAAKLDISESAVEKHVAKAVVLLTRWTEGW